MSLFNSIFGTVSESPWCVFYSPGCLSGVESSERPGCVHPSASPGHSRVFLFVSFQVLKFIEVDLSQYQFYLLFMIILLVFAIFNLIFIVIKRGKIL